MREGAVRHPGGGPGGGDDGSVWEGSLEGAVGRCERKTSSTRQASFIIIIIIIVFLFFFLIGVVGIRLGDKRPCLTHRITLTSPCTVGCGEGGVDREAMLVVAGSIPASIRSLVARPCTLAITPRLKGGGVDGDADRLDVRVGYVEGAGDHYALQVIPTVR